MLITDPDAIATARAEIEKVDGWMIISGTILNETAEWNPDWSFHLIPETVFFGEFFTEVCDANVAYVEEFLDEAGGAFLPNYQWCPWSTAVIAELGNSNETITPGQTPAPTTSPTMSGASAMTDGFVHSAMLALSVIVLFVVV